MRQLNTPTPTGGRPRSGPNNRKAAPGKNREAAAERRVLALRLKQSGASYRSIARQLGVSEAQAFRDVQASLTTLGQLEQGEAKAFRQQQLERLEAMLRGAYKAACRGDPASVRAVLAIMARQDRLRGVDGSPDIDVSQLIKLREVYLADTGRLRNLDALLADLWALRDVAVQRMASAPVGAEDKAVSTVLAVLSELAGALERVARIEEKRAQRDMISVAVVKAYVETVVEVLYEYVAPGRIEAALAKLEGALGTLGNPSAALELKRGDEERTPIRPVEHVALTPAMSAAQQAGCPSVESAQAVQHREPEQDQGRESPAETVESSSASGTLVTCGGCAACDARAERTIGWCEKRRFYVVATLGACDLVDPLPQGPDPEGAASAPEY